MRCDTMAYHEHTVLDCSGLDLCAWCEREKQREKKCWRYSKSLYKGHTPRIRCLSNMYCTTQYLCSVYRVRTPHCTALHHYTIPVYRAGVVYARYTLYCTSPLHNTCARYTPSSCSVNGTGWCGDNSESSERVIHRQEGRCRRGGGGIHERRVVGRVRVR
jgi:hypothetical protein